MARARSGIEPDALTQLANRPIRSAAVPERDAKVVVRLREFRPNRRGSFQVTEGWRQVPLLSKDESHQAVRFGVLIVERQRLRELPACRHQLATTGGVLRPPVMLVCRAGS